MPSGNTSRLNIHCLDSEKQASVFQEEREKGQYVRFQIIKILTGKRKREEKIFSSWKTNLKDSLVELCENLAFAEVAMVPLPFLFFSKRSTIEMLDMLSKGSGFLIL